MNPTAQNEYLVTEVMTATPQKLHLILLEAAIRECERARRLWAENQDELVGEAIVKTQEIVTELVAGLNFQEHHELARRVAGIYNFIFRSLVAAHLSRDQKSLGDAIRVLEIERDTWRQVCRQTATQAVPRPKGPDIFPSLAKTAASTPMSSMSFEA